MKLVLVEWVDAATRWGWHHLSEEDSPARCITVGILCKDTPEYISVGLSHDGEHGDKNWAEVISIAKAAITRMRNLEVKR